VRFFVLLILAVGFVSAIEAEINCPSTVEVGKEFDCSVKVNDVEGAYDVKVEIDKDDRTVAEIWKEGEGKWQSAYYYLKEFSGDKVRLRVKEVGDYKGIFKIRQGDKREFFEFGIEVIGVGAEEESEEVVEVEKVEEKKEIEIVEDLVKSEEVVKKTEGGRILLNSVKAVVDGEVVYESSSSRSLRYAPYVFSFFLIFVLVVLLWERKR